MFRSGMFAVLLALAACSPRGHLVLAPEGAAALGEQERIFVATTRVAGDDKDRFGRGRSETVAFARYDVHVPANRKTGDIVWPPRNGKADPARHFVTTDETVFDESRHFRAELATELRRQPAGQRDAIVFVHGFNNTFSEGLYRIAQLAHDLKTPGVTVHYSWPSAASPLGYAYDRDSALFARDGLEQLLAEVDAAGANKIILVAHSMGSALTMEGLRQLVIRDGTRAKKRIGGVVLISPDLDVDVFRAQARAMEGLPQPFLIFGSSRDRILDISARIAGEPERLGNLTDLSRIADLNVTFLDVSAFSQGAGHFTLAQSPALISLLAGIGDIDAALEADRVGRVGLLPGVVLTVQSATKVVLSPVTAISEGLNQ